MRNNIQKKIQVGLMGIVLVLMYSGCAQLSKEFTKMKSSGAQDVSSEEAKPTAPVATAAVIEEKTQPVEKAATPIEEKAKQVEKAANPIEKKVRPRQSSTPCVHTVRWSGETLSVIAKWYTGKFENWRALVKVNPKLNPNRIFIGSKILIPEDLLKNREPMPQDFLGKFASKRKKK